MNYIAVFSQPVTGSDMSGAIKVFTVVQAALVSVKMCSWRVQRGTHIQLRCGTVSFAGVL